jgi:predicted HTH domain antitoxin
LSIALAASPEQLEGEVRLAAAMKLHEMGRLSSGAAAELAGIPKPVFLSRLADFGIASFCMSEGELAEDLANA